MDPEIKIVIAAQANQFKSEIDALQKRLAKLEASLGSTSNTMRKKFVKSTNQGQTALLDFSRVIQDAPFGIIGVGNNLQQLAGSFGAAARSSGGFAGAIRAMIAAIGTPAGGLVLAVSIVTTALTVFGKRSKGAGSSVTELKKRISELREETERLRSLGAAKLNLAEEVGNPRKIDEEREAQIRNLRVIELRIDKELEVLKANLLNLKALREQQTVIGGIGNYLQKYIQFKLKSIQLTLKAIGEAASETFDALKQLYPGLKLIADSISSIKELDTPDAAPSEEERQITKEYNDLLKERIDAETEIAKIMNQRKKDLKKVDALQRGVALPDFDFGEIDQADFLENVFKPGVTSDRLAQSAFFKVIRDTYDNVVDEVKIAQGEALAKIKGLGLGGVELMRKLFNEDFQNLQAVTITQGVTDLFNTITTAAIEGGNIFEAAGRSILKTLGRFLSEYGSLLITFGLLTKKRGELELANLSPDPFTKIATGAAAIALGVAAAAVGGALTALAGGTAGAGGAGSATGGGSTNVQSPSFAPSEEVVVFEIQGEKLIGVLNRTQARIKRTSGGRLR